MGGVEIIPGESIGPIQLGMTQDEITKLGKYAGSDRMECEYDSSGKCSKISIRPVCYANRFLPETVPFRLTLYEIDLTGSEPKSMVENYSTIGLCFEWDIHDDSSSDLYRVSVFAKLGDTAMKPEQKPEDKPQEPKRLQGFIDMMIGNLAHWNDDPEEYDRRKFEQESSLKLNEDAADKEQTNEKETNAKLDGQRIQ